MKNNLGIAGSNMQRRGQIKACLVGKVPSPDVLTTEFGSARIACWNAVGEHSAVSATTTM